MDHVPLATLLLSTHQSLDFDWFEIADLFSQYECEYKVKVEKDVVVDIHAGLTNICGHTIQQHGGNCDLRTWKGLFFRLLGEITHRPVYMAMMTSIEKTEEPDATLSLLRRLCYGEGVLCSASAPFRNLQNLGFASEKENDNVEARHLGTLLVIKSELIRKFSLIHVVRDQPAFSFIPLIKDKKKIVDIPALLTQAIRHFQADVITAAYTTAKKEIYNSTEYAPRESVYQFQFFAVLLKALKEAWMVEFEASSWKTQVEDRLSPC